MDRLIPDYSGNNLVNLVAELERRLTGVSPSRGLRSELAALIPPARNYLLVVFDGLGSEQLSHPGAEVLRSWRQATLEAPFPTTTTVGLTSVVTGLTPRQHGVIGYRQWLPDLGKVVSLLRWTDLSGKKVRYDTSGFLPAPNLWERLAARRVRGVVVQPAAFFNTPLSRMLYGGAEVRGYESPGEIDPTFLVSLSARTLAMIYHHAIDVAAHEKGQKSTEYGQALTDAARLWTRLAARLPPDTVMVGTSDHGHFDLGSADKLKLTKADTQDIRWWGDSRSLMVKGPSHRIKDLADHTGAELVNVDQLLGWLGRGKPHPGLPARMPDALLLARDRTGIFPSGMDRKKIGHHGGLSVAEVGIPLLVATRN